MIIAKINTACASVCGEMIFYPTAGEPNFDDLGWGHYVPRYVSKT